MRILDIPDTYNTFLPVASGKQQRMQVDVSGMFGNQPVVIEWDSWWWHSGAGSKKPYSVPAERDARKTEALLSAGYAVVRIREERPDVALPLLELQHSSLLQVRHNYLRDGSEFDKLLHEVYAWLASLNRMC